MRLAHVIALAASALVLSMEAAAEPLRIMHAEPVRFQSSPTSTQKSGPSAQRMTFDAFGRRFELEVEPNESLLAELSPQQLQRLDSLQVLRGSLRGHANSWVRLSLVNGAYSGALWDGAELYGIDAYATLKTHLDNEPAGGGTLIYRLSDTYGGLNDGLCGAGDGEQSRASPMGGYKALMRELRESASLVGTREITVSMLVDSDFAQRFPSTSMEEMVARMNIVDGIFDWQTGVNIVAADFRAFQPFEDPFTTSDSDALLLQVGSYRTNTPEVRTRGLAHLITGKELAGDVVGVAYVGALCTVETGVGLSQEMGSAVTTALVIAHELGHNFGAQHDGQAGSACATTPHTFLMSPFFNNSSEFSQCSRDSIAAHVATAACLTPARVRDIALSAPAGTITSVPGEIFEFVVDVASAGEDTAFNIAVSADLGYGVQVQDASLGEGTCSISGQRANCQLPQLAAGDVRQLRIWASSQTVGTYSSTVTAISSNDHVAANNIVNISIEIMPKFDVSISFSPETVSVVSSEEFEMTATVTATSVGTLVDTMAQLQLFGFDIVAVETSLAPCSPMGVTYSCALGTLLPGESADITMRLAAFANHQSSGTISVTSASQGNTTLRTVPLPVQVTPRLDLAIDPLPYEVVAVVGQAVEIPVVIRSVGAQAMPDARLLLRGASEDIVVELVWAGGTCTTTQYEYECALGTLAPGTVLNAVLRARSDVVGRTYLYVSDSPSSGDEIAVNSHHNFLLDVRPEVDVRVPHFSGEISLRDGIETTRGILILSQGVRDATDITARVTLPNSFVLQSAQMEGEQCSISGSVATCTLATLSPNQTARVEMTFVAPEPGSFSGVIEVSAAEDADPSNNSAPLVFDVRANTDARAVGPTNRHVLVNETEEWVFSVENGRYALPDSSLELEYGLNVVLESISASRGTCTLESYRVRCSIGTLEPNEVFSVTMRASVTSGTSTFIYSQFSSPADIDFLNNRSQVYISVDEPGDVALAPVPSNLRGTLKERTTIQLEMHALTRVEESFVELGFDPAQVSDPQATNAYECEWGSRPARCRVGAIDAGETRQLTFSFVPQVEGEIPIQIRVGARNDRNASNDTQTAIVRVTAPASGPQPQPQPQPPKSSSGGGGGGGSLSAAQLLLLALLLMIKAIRARQWS